MKIFSLITLTAILSISNVWGMDEDLQSASRHHHKVTMSAENYDKDYIINNLLPVIRQITSYPMYQSYDAFMDNRNLAGFPETMTLPSYRELVLQVHGEKLRTLGITILDYDLQYYDRRYIDTYLLPSIQKLMPHILIYKSYDAFMDNRNLAGFPETMTLPAYRELVLQVHGDKLRTLGITIPECDPFKPQIKFTLHDDRTVASKIWNDELKHPVQQIGSTVAKTSKEIVGAITESKEVKGAVDGVRGFNKRRKDWF